MEIKLTLFCRFTLLGKESVRVWLCVAKTYLVCFVDKLIQSKLHPVSNIVFEVNLIYHIFLNFVDRVSLVFHVDLLVGIREKLR